MPTGDAEELRRRLRKIQREYAPYHNLVEEIDALMPFTYRTRHKTAAPAKATRKSTPKLTDDQIISIICYALDNPEVDHRTVGQIFRVDGGRVSELLGSIRNKRLDRLRDEVAQARWQRKWKY